MDVKDIIPGKITINELVKQFYDSGGFVAKHVATGVDILEKMIKDDCVKILSFPACITSTGTRGVIVDLVKNKLVDVIITTCGTLDHDLARIWKPYTHGHFEANDEELHQKGIYRLGNIFIPKESYGIILEDKLQPILQKIYSEGKKELSTKELCWEIGKQLETADKKEESILYWAWKNKIPVFIPGITDGAVGSQLWMFNQKHSDFKINLLLDEKELANIVFDVQVEQSSTGSRKTNSFSRPKKLGALMVGGGISKHHTIWWAQFGKGLDYAVYITTAVEWDGSLSGAKTKEAISWGKIKEQAKHITIQGDATILLPLMVSALKERL